MREKYRSHLDWIASQQKNMEALVTAWGNINSHAFHAAGLSKMLEQVDSAFKILGGTHTRHTLSSLKTLDKQGAWTEQSLGEALVVTKRPKAPVQILLGGHYDTVFPIDHAFQEVRSIDTNQLNGPGITDMKGGLIIMLHALQALEQSDWADRIGWKIVINPDEEIGSPGSADLIIKTASECHLGLIFEPSLPDGSCAAARKGSANYTVVIRGRGAHVGRAFDEGRNALAALARFITVAHEQNAVHENVILNVGKVEGGGPVNIVPDLAICQFNMRVEDIELLTAVENILKSTLSEIENSFDVQTEWTRHHVRPPKPFTPATRELFTQIQDCAQVLDQTMKWKDTGGVCDGNLAASTGIPVIDTLGARGGAIHTSDEYLEINSLSERAQLTALYLMRLAAQEIQLPQGENHETFSC